MRLHSEFQPPMFSEHARQCCKICDVLVVNMLHNNIVKKEDGLDCFKEIHILLKFIHYSKVLVLPDLARPKS